MNVGVTVNVRRELNVRFGQHRIRYNFVELLLERRIELIQVAPVPRKHLPIAILYKVIDCTQLFSNESVKL